MPRPWPSFAALAAAACVSFDPAGPPGLDVSGSYSVTVVTRIENVFEVRTDTFGATLALRTDPANHRLFTGTYSVAQSDSGPFAGELRSDTTFLLTDFGTPPKPLAGVSYVRNLYPWCDFTRLGTGPIFGTLRGDALGVEAQGAIPCTYQLGLGPPAIVHTVVSLSLAAVR